VRLVTYSRNSEAPRVGLVEDDRIIDLAEIAPELPRDMIALIRGDNETFQALRRGHARGDRLPIESVRLLAPIPQPPAYLGVGLNYREHAREAGLAIPNAPLIFNKQASCISGPYDDVLLPRFSQQLDYEGELGIVIGRAARNLSSEQAVAAIVGYVVINDFSVRDWQLSSPTHTLGKSFDTHGPFGPWLSTADEVQDPQKLVITTTVNGETRQNGNTADMIFSCREIVMFLSRFMTLLPGTVITTGTPAGVGFGSRPPAFLHVGDLVAVEISSLGRIANRVIAEADEVKQ
jgi:2-keto-4-pentenoate hydratase/2-oxohepta-3-ene-1,7-dioic acid hydratase in catechol pathway